MLASHTLIICHKPVLPADPLPGIAQPEAATSGSTGGSSGSSGSSVSAAQQGSGSQQGGAAAPAAPAPPHFPVQCPQGEIRLFIGITSRCCTEEVSRHTGHSRRLAAKALSVVACSRSSLHDCWASLSPKGSCPPGPSVHAAPVPAAPSPLTFNRPLHGRHPQPTHPAQQTLLLPTPFSASGRPKPSGTRYGARGCSTPRITCQASRHASSSLR